MRLKRMIAGALVCAALCGLVTAPPAAAAAAPSAFTDITDVKVAEAAETLRLLGVVSGDGTGAFRPEGTLTRAEFCKMAIEVMGKGDEAAAQSSRTIFSDVKGSHWARGYINLAASTPVGGSEDGKGANMLMMGVGDSTFRPGETITYAQAVTVLMRILGYSDQTVATGAAWYDGYLSTAATIELTEGVSLNWNAPITRGQTALLFQNLLYTPSYKETEPYLKTSVLKGRILEESILLDLNATTDDGVTGSVQIVDGESTAVYKTDHVPFDVALAGIRAKLVLDQENKVIAIEPSDKGTQSTVSVVSTEATYLTAAGGVKMEVASDTVVYQDGKKTTYKDVYLGLKSGAQVSFHYNSTGKLEYLFLPTSDVVETAAVAKAGGSSFASLVGDDTDYRVVKNGLAATMADVRTYDTAVYDRATKTLYVSDLRLTGVYENVAPSPVTPLEVTVLGATFPVLSSAYEDFASFKIGDVITLLLTADGQVAGVVSPSAARSTTVGVLKVEGKTGTVTPVADLRNARNEKIVLTGELEMSDAAAAQLQGQLVTVSSSKVGKIGVSQLGGSGIHSDLNVVARTLGEVALADNVRLYERVGNGVPAEITLAQLTRTIVPSSKIAYVNTDYAGRISTIVFDDVTGDQYTYGFSKFSKKVYGPRDEINPGITVNYGNGKNTPYMITPIDTIQDDTPLGVAPSLDAIGSNPRLAAYVELTAVENISRTAITLNGSTPAEGDLSPIGTVTTSDMVLPIPANVGCYNPATETWFASLEEARAYSDRLTIYYDRDPEAGGKVRLIVVK